jgi:uncharacterized repeat protein (TIGR01451 family)
VTQADVNAGLDLVNFATVNTNQFGPVSARATVTVVPTTSLTVVKRANLQEVSVVNQVITWSLTITNTGTADLRNLRVVDPLISGNDNNLKCSPVAQGATLTALSPTTTCFGTYTVTQNDLNTKSSLVNTATVSATGLATPVTATATVAVRQNPIFSVQKEADRTRVDEAGQVLEKKKQKKKKL